MLPFVSYSCFSSCVTVASSSHLRIIFYKASSPQGDFERKEVATWQGALLAMELISYFKELQSANVLSHEIEWATNTELAKSITASRNAASYELPSLAVASHRAEVSGYLSDAHAALQMSLLDAVFSKDESVLKGPTLEKMKAWLRTVAEVYPSAQTREMSHALVSALDSKPSWDKHSYIQILSEAGIVEPDAHEWKWCKEVGSGIGGYPCGLWLLFHTLTANSNNNNAKLTLMSIHGWVTHFYGCRECAQHFSRMWTEEGGAHITSHIDAVLWLWKAHNLVRERLHDDITTSNKLQWPSVEECPDCYTDETRDGSAEISTSRFLQLQWRTGYTFEFMQEIFCYGSDMLECAQYWDSSRASTNYEMSWILLFILLGCVVCFAGYFCCCSDETNEDCAVSKAKAE
jgi:hypothetical protein